MFPYRRVYYTRDDREDRTDKMDLFHCLSFFSFFFSFFSRQTTLLDPTSEQDIVNIYTR